MLKDWKKRDKDYWANEETGEVIWIQKMTSYKKNKYVVFRNPGELLRSFKTKAQALKYAKSYMRRN